MQCGFVSRGLKANIVESDALRHCTYCIDSVDFVAVAEMFASYPSHRLGTTQRGYWKNDTALCRPRTNTHGDCRQLCGVDSSWPRRRERATRHHRHLLANDIDRLFPILHWRYRGKICCKWGMFGICVYVGSDIRQEDSMWSPQAEISALL